MFTQSTMHFCACKYPLLSLQWRYLLPGATPNCLQLTSAFLSWQRLRNCLCKFHSCKYPERSNPHAAPSKPYPLLPPPLSLCLSFLALESTYFSFFFLTARLPLLPSHSYSLPVRRPFYTSQYQPLSTLHCLPFPSLPLPHFPGFPSFAFVTWTHFHCQRQRCTRHLHSNFCLAALEMQLPIPPALPHSPHAALPLFLPLPLTPWTV